LYYYTEQELKKDLSVALNYHTLKGVLANTYKGEEPTKLINNIHELDGLLDKYMHGVFTTEEGPKQRKEATDEDKLKYIEALNSQLGDSGAFSSLKQLGNIMSKLAGNIEKSRNNK